MSEYPKKRSVGEKKAIAIAFLESHGFLVHRPLMTSKQVATLLGVTTTTVANHVAKTPDFPRPYNVGTMFSHSAKRWKAEEIAAWIESRKMTT